MKTTKTESRIPYMKKKTEVHTELPQKVLSLTNKIPDLVVCVVLSTEDNEYKNTLNHAKSICQK